jgi:hypothetical protein
MPRTIGFRVWIDWDFNGVYSDESAYLVQATGNLALVRPDDFMAGGKGQVDSCSLTLRNAGGRFSPLNSSGALYSAIQQGKAYHAPMYIEVSIDGGGNWSRVFTGVCKIPKESGLTLREGPVVEVACRSNDELLLQLRQSTTLAQFRAWIEAGYTEGQLIDALLAAAGVTSRSVDAGLLAAPFVWLDDDSLLEDLWLLAAAGGGRFYSDPDGVARYENAAHWLSHAVSRETITRAGFDRPLEAAYADDDLYNVVTVEASPRVLGAWDVVWEPDEPVVVPPGATRAMTARLRQPLGATFGPEWQAITAGGQNITGYVTVSPTYYAQRVEFSITNSNPYWAAYLRPFRLVGQPVEGGPTHEESRNSAAHGSNGAFFATRGTRTRSVRGNPYVQGKAQAGMLALFLLHQSEYPRLTYQLRGCLGDPGRRLGDRVTISDASVMSSSRDAFVIGIAWRLTPNGFSQDLTAIDAAQLYPYQSTGYFVVHDTTGDALLSSGSKRLFY